MSTPDLPKTAESRDAQADAPSEAGILMTLHNTFRDNETGVRIALQTATGKHKERLEIVLANLRSRKR